MNELNDPNPPANAPDSLEARKALRFELDPTSPTAVADFKQRHSELADIADQSAAYQQWPESGEVAVENAASKILRLIESRRKQGSEPTATSIQVVLRGEFARWYASTRTEQRACQPRSVLTMHGFCQNRTIYENRSNTATVVHA